MSLMVSISGIRGIVGSSLTPEVVVRYASAFAEYCGKGTVVIGRDGRITGKPITHLVSSTLLSMGCDVIALGVCPTPTIQLATERTRATGGVSVTASHNPIIWNGLKFLDSTGLFLDARQNRTLWDIADRGTPTYALWDKMGAHAANDTFIQEHLQAILELPFMNLRALRKRKFKVVVDCVNASGGVIVPNLLRSLGCRVVELNCDVSGIFAHTPEPLPENLTTLCRRVKSEKADLGIAVDPDGDRLVLIDEKGRPFGEEYTIVSVARFVLEQEASRRRKRSSGPPKVVVNLSTTRAVEDIAKQFGAETLRTPVGEINVAQKMKEVGAVIGGEGSGGVIYPAVHLGRDAMVGIALVIQQLAEFGGPLSAFKQSLPQYAITKGKIDVRSVDPDTALERVKQEQGGKGKVNTDDGLRIDFADSWVHLRKSNTEPIIRIIAEARTKEDADAVMNSFSKSIQESRV